MREYEFERRIADIVGSKYLVEHSEYRESALSAVFAVDLKISLKSDLSKRVSMIRTTEIVDDLMCFVTSGVDNVSVCHKVIKLDEATFEYILMEAPDNVFTMNRIK